VATKESTIDKGGFVENVANVSPEPDEKKVRGQPFTYAELGGVLAPLPLSLFSLLNLLVMRLEAKNTFKELKTNPD
jgi:hypothetical protein